MSNDDHPGMKKLQVWITLDKWEELNSLGYTSPTNAVTEGLDLLLNTPCKTPEYSQGIPGLRAKIELLQMVLDERERVIEEKDRRIADLNRFSYVLENREFKLIESQGERMEKPAEEIKADVKEPVTKPARKPGTAQAENKEKELIRKTCKFCGKEFDTYNSKKETCSDKCRTAYNRRKKVSSI